MTRGSRSSGSYRDWEAERRRQLRAAEQAERQRERERKAKERERALADAAARDEEQDKLTRKIEKRVEELETLLRSSLRWDPRIPFASLRRSAAIPVLDLGPLANPHPAPAWRDFAPYPPSAIGRLFGGTARYEAAVKDAEQDFARAQAQYQHMETERQKRVVDARRAHERKVTQAQEATAAHNARIDAMEAGVRAGDRHAVSQYMDHVLKASPYPKGFPIERKTGYVPESALLAVEWYLPPPEIVPENKAYKHIKTRKVVEPVPRPAAEIGQIYQRVIAQVALRTLREVFAADPGELISTVVFNGRVHAVDPVTGKRITPHLITLRATREQFSALVLDEPKSSRSSAYGGISSPTCPRTRMN